MYKNDILDMILVHKNYSILAIQIAKYYTFSIWPCHELSIRFLRLIIKCLV